MEKLLPQNIEAERGVLGSIIIDPEAIVQVADFLQAQDFYRDAHRIIYEIIMHLYERHEPADYITIMNELENMDKVAEAGGPGYLTELVNEVPTSGNVEYYGRIVERMSVLRRLIHAAGEIAATAYEESDAAIAMDKAEKLIFGLSQSHARSDFSAIRDLLSDYMAKLDSLHDRRGSIVGVPTGFTDLDRLTGGFQRSDLIILAARPAVGKCLPAWTLIDNPETGARLTIEECVQQRIKLVHGLSKDGKVRPTAISDWIDSGIKPCFRVKTALGRQVEVTGHHPFLTPQGWRSLAELGNGDAIAVPIIVDCFGTDESMPLDLVRLLAYSLGSSELQNGVLSFTCTDPILIKDFQQIITTRFPGCQTVQTEDDSSAQPLKPCLSVHFSDKLENPLMEWLQTSGLTTTTAQEKYIPANVWTWSKKHLTEFLKTLLSCSDSNYTGNQQPDLTFTISSEKLAYDLQHAFTRFGILASCQPEEDLKQKKPSDRWCITITRPESLQRYLTEIGWSGEKASSIINQSHTVNQPESKEETVIYWDKIIAIEAIGEHQVYDLTVPDGANFIAQDICVHNTSLCLTIAHNAAISYGQSVAVFSLEMSKEQLVQRLLSMDAGIDQQRLRTGWIEDDEWDRIVSAMGRLAEAKIWIDDTAGISTMEMRSKARRLQAEHGVDLIIVDYLQLMQSAAGGKRNENRVQEISEISRSLKGLARELNVPVMALAQLSRQVESRQSKVPQLSDLRESGCVTGDTLVYLPDLQCYQPIRTLIGQSGFSVLALNTQTWQLETRPVSRAFATGRKPIYRLTTQSGRSIRATANHPFLSRNGWRRLDELNPSETIAVPYPDAIAASSQRGFRAEESDNEQITGNKPKTDRQHSSVMVQERTSEVQWESILTISACGEEEVYDLTVEGLHNFIANDIIIHNSIEQDADVVMFIYRDDVYNPDSERKNIADIIVAKHRNGPVGEVSLFFQASQTRFCDLEVNPPVEE